MKKRKKKKNNAHLTKQNKAEQRNKFFKDIQMLLKMYGCEDVYPLISEDERDKLYKTRFRYPKIKPAPGQKIDPQVLRSLKWLLNYDFNRWGIDIKPDGTSISLMTHFTLNHTIYCFRDWLARKKIPGYEKIIKGMEACGDLDNLFNRAFNLAYPTFPAMSMIASNMEDKLYWVKIKYDNAENDATELYLLLEVYVEKPDVIKHEINGKIRLLYRVGWGMPDCDVKWTTLQPKTLGITGSCSEVPVTVYVQSHALYRLSERIDCFSPGIVQYYLFTSLESPIVLHFNDNILVEYRINNIKLGYIVVEYIDGFILVRTFLFLTNNGTPEGQKLEELSGLDIPDKQYWAIDKLSTFYTPDILNNKKLKALFTEAGCQSLFENDFEPFKIKEITGLADKLIEYMKLDEKLEIPYKKTLPEIPV